MIWPWSFAGWTNKQFHVSIFPVSWSASLSLPALIPLLSADFFLLRLSIAVLSSCMVNCRICLSVSSTWPATLRKIFQIIFRICFGPHSVPSSPTATRPDLTQTVPTPVHPTPLRSAPKNIQNYISNMFSVPAPLHPKNSSNYVWNIFRTAPRSASPLHLAPSRPDLTRPDPAPLHPKQIQHFVQYAPHQKIFQIMFPVLVSGLAPLRFAPPRSLPSRPAPLHPAMSFFVVFRCTKRLGRFLGLNVAIFCLFLTFSGPSWTGPVFFIDFNLLGKGDPNRTISGVKPVFDTSPFLDSSVGSCP